MNEEPIDLAVLDRFGAPGSAEAAVRRIMVRAAPALARRAMGRGVLPLIATWARPALAAAAVVAALSVAALAAPLRRDESSKVLASPVAEALDLPAPVDDWVSDGRSPTAADLIVALEDLP